MLAFPEQTNHKWMLIPLVLFLIWVLWRIVPACSEKKCERYETIGGTLVIGERNCPDKSD